MKIFLSYASEQRAIAEPVAYALLMRGHFVFLDKKDLPPSGSYDEQIALAIAQSDLLVFLISPQSVTSGRYTLTELKFAREKWPSARGRVLPVLAETTPLEAIPPYLASIQILTPEGNTAAEVASVVDQIIPTARPSRILPVTIALALISGVISGLVGGVNTVNNTWEESVVTSVAELVGEWSSHVLGPLLASPPYAFTLVIATLLTLWDRMPLSRTVLVLPVVAVAWVCAYNLAFVIMTQLDEDVAYSLPAAPAGVQCPDFRGRETDEAILALDDKVTLPIESFDSLWKFTCGKINKYRLQLKPLVQRLRIIIYIFAGLSAGFVGALVTVLGLGRLSRRLRSLDAVALTTMIGTAVGALLAVSDANNYLLLFIVWQPAVAAAIAWQFTKPAPREIP